MRKILYLLVLVFLFITELSNAQTRKISGQVTDSKGEALQGVMVRSRGENVFTNAEGYYMIEIPAESKTLWFKGIERKVSVKITEDDVINVQLLGENEQAIVQTGSTGSSGYDTLQTQEVRKVYIAYKPSVVANYFAPVGIQAGFLGDIGGYVSSRYFKEDGGYNIERFSVTAGVSRGFSDVFHLYGGLGYGQYSDVKLAPVQGLEIDAGMILNFGKINLNAGVSALNFTSDINFTFGLGIIF